MVIYGYPKKTHYLILVQLSVSKIESKIWVVVREYTLMSHGGGRRGVFLARIESLRMKIRVAQEKNTELEARVMWYQSVLERQRVPGFLGSDDWEIEADEHCESTMRLYRALQENMHDMEVKNRELRLNILKLKQRLLQKESRIRALIHTILNLKQF